jgi:hypothetical protein
MVDRITQNISSISVMTYGYKKTGWDNNQEIEDIITEFNKVYEYIAQPLGINGTYGLDGQIEALQEAKCVQTKNKNKLQQLIDIYGSLTTTSTTTTQTTTSTTTTLQSFSGNDSFYNPTNAQYFNDSILLNEQCIMFGKYNGLPIHSALLFENCNIPKGVFITDAYVKLYACNNTECKPVCASIYFWDTDSASLPDTYKEFDNLDLTKNYTSWVINNDWIDDDPYNTPDISYPLQEVINRPHWEYGNNLLFIIKDNNSQGFRKFDVSGFNSLKPEFYVSWESTDVILTSTTSTTTTTTTTTTSTTTTTTTSTTTTTTTTEFSCDLYMYSTDMLQDSCVVGSTTWKNKNIRCVIGSINLNGNSDYQFRVRLAAGPTTETIINNALIAYSNGNDDIKTGTNEMWTLTFNGSASPSAVIPPGEHIWSDPISFPLSASQDLVLSANIGSSCIGKGGNLSNYNTYVSDEDYSNANWNSSSLLSDNNYIIDKICIINAETTTTTTEYTWLNGFSKRIQIKINKPGEILYDYPVRIKISNSCGKNGQDLTEIFKELEYEWMQFRIAFTKDDGVTQLYGEIQNWNYPTSGSFNDLLSDPASGKAEANIFVKIPELDMYYETYIYMYFDKNAVDNNNYIGNNSTSASTNVWDENFLGVYHFEGYPDNEANIPAKDSTINRNNALPSGSITGSQSVSGHFLNKAYKLLGTDQYFDLQFNSITGPATFELIYQPPAASASPSGTIFSNNLEYPNYKMKVNSDGTITFGYNHNNSYEEYITSTMQVSSSEGGVSGGWYYIAGVSDQSTLKIYINSWYQESNVKYPEYSPNAINNSYKLGASHNTTSPTTMEKFIRCNIDEVRISNTARTLGWIDYTFYNYYDFIIEFIT